MGCVRTFAYTDKVKNIVLTVLMPRQLNMKCDRKSKTGVIFSMFSSARSFYELTVTAVVVTDITHILDRASLKINKTKQPKVNSLDMKFGSIVYSTNFIFICTVIMIIICVDYLIGIVTHVYTGGFFVY